MYSSWDTLLYPLAQFQINALVWIGAVYDDSYSLMF